MQKSRLGISVGLLGAAVFFACYFGGYTAAIVLAGYILLFEDNVWLKRATVKGVALMFAFPVLASVIYLIPNIISLVDSIFNVFGGSFYITFISNIIGVIECTLDIVKKLVFIVLGLKAFNQGTVRIPVIDSLINKYMD